MRNSRDRILALVIFASAFLIFWFSPVQQFTDSYYSLLVSQSLIDHRSFALDNYKIPRLPPEYHDHTWKNGYIHQLEIVDGHLYYYMPPGSSVLSVPYVAIGDLFGISPRNPDGTYNAINERKLQSTLAAILMALLTGVIFFTARLVLPLRPSLIITLGAALGTQIWSTISRALWADTWGLLLLGLVVYLLAADELQKRTLNPIFLVTLLSWAYFVRPSNSVVIVATTVYVLLQRRQHFRMYALTGLIWLAAFVLYSWTHYHAVLPTYFRINRRLNFEHFGTALAGNLISPSRGLFVFVPITIFVFLTGWYFRSELRSRSLLYLSTANCLLYLLVVSTFDPWWAGASFGPRYLAPLVPWILLTAVLGVDALRKSELQRSRRRILIAFGIVLLFFSVAINAVGALSRAAWLWNDEGDINHDSLKVWRIRDSQLASAFLKPPLPRSFPPLPAKLELSNPSADPYLGSGWSGPEEGFRWTDDQTAQIVFSLNGPRDLVMRMSFSAFLVPGKHNRQRMSLLLNGQQVESSEFSVPQLELKEILLPRELLKEKNVLEFQLPDTASPLQFQISPDERSLGIAVQWIEFKNR